MGMVNRGALLRLQGHALEGVRVGETKRFQEPCIVWDVWTQRLVTVGAMRTFRICEKPDDCKVLEERLTVAESWGSM